jgi:hypothetical protein
MTPEGRVKNQVRKRLEHHGLVIHTKAQHGRGDLVGSFFMPVAGPFSVHGIHDFVGCWRGVFFSIETKAPDNPDDHTAAQGGFQVAFTRAGGICLTGVRGPEAVDHLRELVYQRIKAMAAALTAAGQL